VIELDGSLGEGGGQVLRTSLTLSMLTGMPFRLVNIRGGRPKPGLRAQHLAAVHAAASICHAHTSGARFGSIKLEFQPGDIRSGEYTWQVGTAGSTSLVLQTVALPLTRAKEASNVAVEGGTHVPWSPSFHYLEWCWGYFMRELGFQVEPALRLAGYYPGGGGSITARITPAGAARRRDFLERGDLRRLTGISCVSNLSVEIAARLSARSAMRLADSGLDIDIETKTFPARGKGAFMAIFAEFAHSRVCTLGLGAAGKPAERVADEAVDGLLEFLASGGAIDPFMADQILLPLSAQDLAGRFRTTKITRHLLTNAAVVEAFDFADIHISGEEGSEGLVLVTPRQAGKLPGS
jgi:RNA 3'-terminal phosphate cyclase (ATP)